VKVKIMTRDANYNPFDEDEQVVGFEENNRVYTPEGAAGWTGGEKSKFASMLDSGRRRERGVGVDNDVEEVVTRTTFDDERYQTKKKEKVQTDAPRLSDEKPTDLAQQVLDEAAAETNGSGGSAPSPTEAYKPKVSTWGVFPRPDNISATYGGGKTIKAGEFVAETEEEKEKRRARVKAKLNKYREEAGITVDNGTRSRWNVALTECKTLMRLGKLVEARDIVEPIVLLEEINPRTALGGEITFHYAMCLDNTQRPRRGAGDVQAVRGKSARHGFEAGGPHDLGHDHREHEDEGGPVRLRRHQRQVRPVPDQDDHGAAGLEDRDRTRRRRRRWRKSRTARSPP
jgi:hypothetical protein